MAQGGHTLHGSENAAALAPGGEPLDTGSYKALHLAQHSRVRIVLQHPSSLTTSILWASLPCSMMQMCSVQQLQELNPRATRNWQLTCRG